MKFKYSIALVLSFLFVLPVFGQEDMKKTSTEPSRFDFGRMWTFEHAPLDYFEDTYDWRPSEEWLEHVRKSSLRFSTFCSASFISPDGLILTNHHCSRGLVTQIQEAGENLDSTGFYAESMKDERRAPGLFVEQLVKLVDITDRIESAVEGADSKEGKNRMKKATIDAIEEEYGQKEGWEDLRLQVVTYYEGGKYSLYGYKRYDDIRLVLVPEGALGFFGGDPDNFTYPRYNLDFTMWRAYDDEGNPVNSSEHYFKFNPDGVEENTPVFVIGNPGNTERYRTAAQLAYDRDIRFPLQIQLLEARKEALDKMYEKSGDPSLQNTIFSLSNALKAFNGILDGLRDEALFQRKVDMQEIIRKNAMKQGAPDYWAQIENAYDVIRKNAVEQTMLRPSPMTGSAVQTAHKLYDYREAMLSDTVSEDRLAGLRSDIMNMCSDLKSDAAENMLANVLETLKQYADPGDDYLEQVLDGKNPAAAAAYILEKSALTDQKKTQKLLKKQKKVEKANDPMLNLAVALVPAYKNAGTAYRTQANIVDPLEEKVAYQAYEYFGSSLPPDATFTLRISDGVVKGYPYNGTRAPIHTTYYGMYDRHYSHGQEFPWNLPEQWMNPPGELLQTPLNFVSTNDIIGGNSGSPIINKDLEIVGLIFDGNIESLPGNFIFDPSVNRSVSVHAGGIFAAIQYIYGANRIMKELIESGDKSDFNSIKRQSMDQSESLRNSSEQKRSDQRTDRSQNADEKKPLIKRREQ